MTFAALISKDISKLDPAKRGDVVTAQLYRHQLETVDLTGGFTEVTGALDAMLAKLGKDQSDNGKLIASELAQAKVAVEAQQQQHVRSHNGAGDNRDLPDAAVIANQQQGAGGEQRQTA